MATSFSKVYDCFYSKITDDMFMELDKDQTAAIAKELLINALPWFEFPRVAIFDYNEKKECFNANLSIEEIHIIATYMVVGWLDQQLATVELTRMKYSSSDFKMTSQANHMSRLTALRKEYERVGFHSQRLYKRRKPINGIMKSTISEIMASSVRNGIVEPAKTSISYKTDGSTVDGDYVDQGGSSDTWEELPELDGSSSSSGGSLNVSGDDVWEKLT